MRVGIIGCGAVGSHVARMLPSGRLHELVLVDPRRAASLAAELGPLARAAPVVDVPLDAVVLATRWGKHGRLASDAMRMSPLVVSVADSIEDVRALLDLDPEARERAATLVVGAGFAPGYTGVLARHLAIGLDHTDEIHVAKVGTGGPWCARQHHRALGETGLDYRDGAWVPRAGGSGRELFWFPEPIGGQDCYRAALADPIVLAAVFSGISRITARMAATRRDRLTGRLPMLAPPHPDGGLGAVRVELRGRRGRERIVNVVASVAAPSEAAAAVAVTAVEVLTESPVAPGAAPLPAVVDPGRFVERLRAVGVVPQEFVGAN